MLTAYHQIRPLGDNERAMWPAAFAAAGARFWLSRLKDQHFPRRGALTHIKDPEPFKQVLEFAHEYAGKLNSAWP